MELPNNFNACQFSDFAHVRNTRGKLTDMTLNHLIFIPCEGYMDCVANLSDFLPADGHIHSNESDLGVEETNRCFAHLDHYIHLAQSLHNLYTLVQDNRTQDNTTFTIQVNGPIIFIVDNFRI